MPHPAVRCQMCSAGCPACAERAPERGAGRAASRGQGRRPPRLARAQPGMGAQTAAPPARLPAPFWSQIGPVWDPRSSPKPHGQPVERGRGRWQQISFLAAAQSPLRHHPALRDLQPRVSCGLRFPPQLLFPGSCSLSTTQSSEWILIPPWVEHVKPISRAGAYKRLRARSRAPACPPSPAATRIRLCGGPARVFSGNTRRFAALPSQGDDRPLPRCLQSPLPALCSIFQVPAASQPTAEQTERSFREQIPQIAPRRSLMGSPPWWVPQPWGDERLRLCPTAGEGNPHSVPAPEGLSQLPLING